MTYTTNQGREIGYASVSKTEQNLALTLHKKSVLFPVHTWIVSPRKYYDTTPCTVAHC
jgi:hypothetical protein